MEYTSQGDAVFTAGPNVKIHSTPSKVAMGHTGHSGVTFYCL